MRLFVEYVLLLANVMSENSPASKVTEVLILVGPQSFFPCHSPDPFRSPTSMKVTIEPQHVAMDDDPHCQN